MVTVRLSNQQGPKSRQNSCQVQPPENIGNLSASKPCFGVQTTVSTVVVESAASISESELQTTEKVVGCAAHPPKSSKVTENGFIAIGGLHEDKLSDNL